MKSRPIFFSGLAGRALLNTKPDVWPAEPVDPVLPFKWQTRSLINPQPQVKPEWTGPHCNDLGVWFWTAYPDRGDYAFAVEDRMPRLNGRDNMPGTFLQPGDLLWVREAFMAESRDTIHYRADGWGYSDCPSSGWKPSIVMPRWASRLTLEVESVRVERVQDITEDDARAEGCPAWEWNPEQPLTTGERAGDSPYRSGFACLWDEIHDEPTWKSNPWVWVITFKRLSQEVAQRRLAA